MTTLHDIERAIESLSSEQLSAFRDWFSKYDADTWDREFEEDAQRERLDAVAAEAMRALGRGECREL